MPNYRKVIINTNSYVVSDMIEGTTPICDTKTLSGNSWTFTSSELPATVYYETTRASMTTTKEFVFATDSEHVVCRSGYTIEEENTGFRKMFGRTFVSSDGSPVTVNNGLDKSKILSGEISGRTVKNYITKLDAKASNLFSVSNNDWKYEALYGTQYNETIQYDVLASVKPSTRYVLIVDVKTNTLNQAVDVIGFGSGICDTVINLQKNVIGVKKFEFTTKSTITDFSLKTIFPTYTSGILEIAKATLVEYEYLNVINTIPFGLSSTQAIIENNGMKYSFVEPIIKGTVEGLVPTDATLPTLVAGDVLDRATKTITFKNATTRVLTDAEYSAYSKYEKVIELNAI